MAGMVNVVIEEAKRILARPSLADILPYKFINGTTIDKMEGRCSNCNKVITQDNIRAEISFQGDHSIAIRGHCICYDCRVFTPFEGRYDDSGSCLNRSPNGWIPGRYANTIKVELLTKLLQIFSSLGN